MFADLIKIYGRFLIVCTFICACFLYISCTAEKAYARTGADSLIAFENNTNLSFKGIASIVKSIVKIVKLTISCLIELFDFKFNEISNTCIPYEIGPNIPSHCPPQKNFSFSVGAIIMMIAIFVVLPLSFFIPIVGQLLAIAALIMYYPIFVACIGTYSLSPAEYIMMNEGQKELQCTETNGKIVVDPTKQEPYVTVQDVPFMYNCTEPAPDSPEIAKKAYVGIDSEFCATERSRAFARPKMTHKTFIMFVDIYARMAGKRSKCARDHLVIGDPDTSPQSIDFNIGFPIKAKLYTYYTLMGNRVKLCSAVGNDILMPNPILLGCVHIPPPIEHVEIEEYLKEIIKDTRCQYIMPGSHRKDLSKVADAVIMGRDTNIRDYNSVYLFLKSDWHILSTVVGCFEDMLEKVFLDATYGAQNQPFLKLIQNGLKSIVFACLALYISLTGIRVMSSSQPPSRGEWIMFAIKVAVVLYVATGDIWFTPGSKGTNKNDAIGLYPTIIDTMQLVGTIFMDAREMNDPVKMCYYKYGSNNGQNLLGQNTIEVEGKKIQLSVWDYVDCILVTYLNFNSCNFTAGGIIVMWLVTTCIFFGGSGIVLCLFSLIYLYMILKVVFEYAHIMILSMFVVTILVMISPIIMCFYLFDITKEITESWFHMLLGYMIYPGALFAFLALMLATFDSVFYGANLNHNKVNELYECSLRNDCNKITESTLEELCGSNYKEQSLYCAVLSSAIGKTSITNCGTRSGTFVNFFTEQRDIPLIGEVTMAKEFTISLFMKHIISLMLFALLFNFMMGSIVEFIAQIFGVPSLSGYAVGGKIGDMLAQKVAGAGLAAMGMPIKAAMKGAKAGLGKIKDKLGGKGGGKGGGDGEANRDSSSGSNEGANEKNDNEDSDSAVAGGNDGGSNTQVSGG